jgi:tellurite resistance protein TehA-like permease
MSTQDILAFVLFAGFGLWLAILPKTVIRFYTWFHKGRFPMPRPTVIRVIGACWVILVSALTLTARKA